MRNVGLVVIALVLAACSRGGRGTGGFGGPVTRADGGGLVRDDAQVETPADAGFVSRDAGPRPAIDSGPSSCLAVEEPCLRNSQCCSEFCDTETYTCAEDSVTCLGIGGSCTATSECCAGTTCDTTTRTCTSESSTCASLYEECSYDSDCCSGYTCETGYYCTPPTATTCGSLYDSCDYDSDCCSGYTCDPYSYYCTTGGGSTCGDTYDYCTADSACCSGYCDTTYYECY